MKETIEVSIAGIAFSMDTEAYALLKEYLDSIQRAYAGDSDGAEILADIEARVCELILNEQGPDQLVSADRIRRIIDQMGLPDDISGEGERPKATVENTEKLARRLYRNSDGAKLGGVCSGLGTYFDVEPVMIRLGFVAPLLLTPIFGVMHMGRMSGYMGTLFGVFVMLYLLLWFAIPKAKTPRQKLEMRGEKITASSIQQNFRSDFKDLPPSPKNERSASVWADIVYLFGRIILFCVKLVVGIIAVVFMLMALGMIGISIALLCGVPGSSMNLFYSGWGYTVADLPGGMGYAFLSLLALMLIFGGISYMLWRLISNQSFPKKTLGVMGGVGIIILLFVLIMTARFWDDGNGRGRRNRPATESRLGEPVRDTSWVEEIKVGDSTVLDTVKVEYFEYDN